jgi:hypothetical protein
MGQGFSSQGPTTPHPYERGYLPQLDRKKLEEVFGHQLASLINGSGHESEANVKPTEDLAQD